MSCKTVYIKTTKSHECDDFLFVNKPLNFQDSVKYCKDQNYRLARVKIKSGEIDEVNFKKYTSEVVGHYYRVGLKFEHKNNTWFSRWSDGANYDVITNGEVKLYSKAFKDKKCYEVIANKDMKRVFKTECGRAKMFLCRKQGNSVEMDSVTKGNKLKQESDSQTTSYRTSNNKDNATQLKYNINFISKSSINTKFSKPKESIKIQKYTTKSSAYDSSSSKYYVTQPRNKHNTSSFRSSNTKTTLFKPGSITLNDVYSYYQGNNTLLFGISSALILFFILTLFLLAYIFNKKKKRKNNNKKRIHDNSNRNTRISLDELGELVDVISRRQTEKVTTDDVIKIANDEKFYLASLPISCDVRCSEALKTEIKILVNKIPAAEPTINDVTSSASLRDERVENKSEIMTSFPLSCDVHINEVNNQSKSSTKSSIDDDSSFWIHVSEVM